MCSGGSSGICRYRQCKYNDNNNNNNKNNKNNKKIAVIIEVPVRVDMRGFYWLSVVCVWFNLVTVKSQLCT